MKLPRIVSQDEWQHARAELLIKEKVATKAHDVLNAERRRLPMVKIEREYRFEGPDGMATLHDLFEGRRQLIIYHFMFGPDDDEGCRGCSMFVDNIGHPAHLHARDTSLAVISRAPLAKTEPFRARMGWSVPWYSSFGSDFNYDFKVTTDEGETPVVSVFLRDQGSIYRTYFTTGRGTEGLGSNWTFLDLTPLGRQEKWEDSPAGWPQTQPYEWWRHHDSYDVAVGVAE